MSPSFSDLGVAPRVTADLAARGIVEPFPIQSATLADSLAGRDVAGKAPTGAGKTLAFGLPLVARCGPATPHHPSALVLVPTRELAGQVADELGLLARSHGMRVAAVYGGVGFGPQRRALREAVEILVACPGRLVDLINQGDVRLDRVQVVVLDEADRMADMGFLPEVRRLLDQMPADRQTLLFSATLDGDVDVIVKQYQRDPVRHELEGDDGKLPDATHLFWRVNRDERLGHCADVIRSAGSTIVFCRTRHGAERVAKRLSAQGVEAVAIHGDRSQAQRERALRDFTQGRAQALVATDVAARGIHVDDVAAVVHLDPPADHKDYVHRSGRTARAGTRGTVISLVADAERGAVTKIQKALGLPTGTTQPDLTVIPKAPPRHQAKPTRSEKPRPRNDRPPRDATPARDRPTHQSSQTGPKLRSRQAEQQNRRNPDGEARGEGAKRESLANQQGANRESLANQHGPQRGNFASEQTPKLRSRQAEQHRQARPDGEARGGGAKRENLANEQSLLRFYDAKKGFGFIIRPGKPDLFVHSSALAGIDPRELTDGRAVAFETEQGRKGEQAARVRLAPRRRPSRP